MKTKALFSVLFFLILFSCEEEEKQKAATDEKEEEQFQVLSDSLNTDLLQEGKYLQFTYTLSRDSDSIYTAKVLTGPYGEVVSMDTVTGAGQIPDSATARFWPQIITAPYALALSDLNWNKIGDRYLKGRPHQAYRVDINKEPVEGDSMLVFISPRNGLVQAIAELDTLDAVINPDGGTFAVSYEEYSETNNLKVPTRLNIWKYEDEEGTTEQVGSILIENVMLTEEAGQETEELKVE